MRLLRLSVKLLLLLFQSCILVKFSLSRTFSFLKTLSLYLNYHIDWLEKVLHLTVLFTLDGTINAIYVVVFSLLLLFLVFLELLKCLLPKWSLCIRYTQFRYRGLIKLTILLCWKLDERTLSEVSAKFSVLSCSGWHASRLPIATTVVSGPK